MTSFLHLLRNIALVAKKNCDARLLSTTSQRSMSHTLSTIPEMPSEARVILPISVNRYQGSQAKRDEYDHCLNLLLQGTAKKLEEGKIKQIDVVSTAELHTSWSPEIVMEITDHFYRTHASLLKLHSNYYTWNGLIAKIGRSCYEDKYEIVKALSQEGSDWYHLMKDTHKRTQSSIDLSSSLDYQRREYAGIVCMSDYSHILYFGKITSAWAHIYEIFKNDVPPLFVRATLQQVQPKPVKIINDDFAFKAIENLIEEVISSPNISDEKKISLCEHVNTLFKTHIRGVSRVIDSSDEMPDHPIQGASLKPY